MPVVIKSVCKQYQMLFRGISYSNPFKQQGKRTIEGPRNCVYSDRFIRKFTCSVPTPTGSISVNSDRSRSERSSRQIYPFGADWFIRYCDSDPVGARKNEFPGANVKVCLQVVHRSPAHVWMKTATGVEFVNTRQTLRWVVG